ncbi:MAG TPA: CoA pyrophosphatase [Acidimicrobiales bacterium]|nr:CoA pyrophosphatase [Acidimicrobiales bacterium]
MTSAVQRGGPQHIPRPAGARAGRPAPWADVSPADVDLRVDTVARLVRDRGPAGAPDVTVADARAAAVLVALFGAGGADDDARVVLTRRSSTLRNHRGEVAFPGGRQEEGEALADAALRETHEELGIEPATIHVVGELDHLTTVASRFVVAPYVGVLPGGRPDYRPNAAEIDRAFDVALRELLEPDVYVEEVWDFPWGERHVSFFLLEGETVWGATARILRQLLLLVTATNPDDDGRAPL